MPNLRGKIWTTTTPAQVDDANWWEDHLISDEDAEYIASLREQGDTLGHTIVNPSGSDMPDEKKLKFLNAEVTDDPTNETTIVDCQGEKGDAATIQIGTVETVPYAEGASVVNSGTESAAIFDFQIPRGASGGAWGGITGTLSDQTDLNNVLTGIDTDITGLETEVTSINTDISNLNTAVNNRVLKAGDTMTGDLEMTGANIKINTSNKGVMAIDSTGFEYPLIKDNGTNMWIGAQKTSGQHHAGTTIISAGYDTANSKPFDSIQVSVPNATNTGATNSLVFHERFYKLAYNSKNNYDAVSVPSGTSALTQVASFTLTKGTWLVGFGLQFAKNATGFRIMKQSTNASETSVGGRTDFMIMPSSGGNYSDELQLVKLVSVSADSQTMYIHGMQNSGSALNAYAWHWALKVSA